MILPLVFVLLPQQPAPHGPEPGPRAPLAGVEGFQIVSKLDFGGQNNRLTALYTFPDRVRWHFENYDAVLRSEHQFFYRQGERVYELVSGGPSREITGDARTTVLLQMELRRAVMFWPDGFAWQENSAGSKSAPVEVDSCCHELPLGTLVATLEGARPRRIEARDATGKALEAMEIRAWQEARGRTWPLTLALESEGKSIVETIESIETRVHFLELSFLPPDLRPIRVIDGSGPRVLSRDLVAMTYAPRPLPSNVGWSRALELAHEWIREAGESLKHLGLSVDPVPTFELSARGEPVRCLVRLSGPALQPPPGYESLAERAGLFLTLEDLKSVDGAALARLLAAIPDGSKATAPYVRIHDRKTLPIEVVQPLVPAD